MDQVQIARFLITIHPYNALPPDQITALADQLEQVTFAKGEQIYAFGQDLPGVYLIYSGTVDVTDEFGHDVSHLGPHNAFGERGLFLDGRAATNAHCSSDLVAFVVPAPALRTLRENFTAVDRFFTRDRGNGSTARDLSAQPVGQLMTPDPVTCAQTDTAQQAAQTMRAHRVSALCVLHDGALSGILSVRDISSKLVAEGQPFDTPVAALMTADPLTLPTSAIGSDVLHMMLERRISHVPIVSGGDLVGIVSQTDLTRFQALSPAEVIAGITRADTAEEMARQTAQIPELLTQLVATGRRHDIVTRLITDVADTVTRRLCALAEEKLGPAPVDYLWLACGSQGRQEQTGVSDQDNCLILDNAVTDTQMRYFHDLAQFVCDGLNTCGYVYCPGDMMATNPMWCQPLRVWEGYFADWIATPDENAQMLASVMFDLRAISGTDSLFQGLQRRTLAKAAENSIFVRFMVSNSLKHSTPLGLLRGLATIRSGEHKNQIDMKHNGVVPIVDLGRVFALRGGLEPANTRARLEAAQAAGLLSERGGADLLDAYDVIAGLRLESQAKQIRMGMAPDNYIAPAGLSDFERSHLRNAFVVVKSMQSAVDNAG